MRMYKKGNVIMNEIPDWVFVLIAIVVIGGVIFGTTIGEFKGFLTKRTADFKSVECEIQLSPYSTDNTFGNDDGDSRAINCDICLGKKGECSIGVSSCGGVDADHDRIPDGCDNSDKHDKSLNCPFQLIKNGKFQLQCCTYNLWKEIPYTPGKEFEKNNYYPGYWCLDKGQYQGGFKLLDGKNKVTSIAYLTLPLGQLIESNDYLSKSSTKKSYWEDLSKRG
ncbi:MAG: hypothetical protein QF632_00330 [Candidatus Woesearchaeota archaeon]|nr:hypothetical protein [Candidatus Woesearchaeota archaeon]MDP7458069.1 hypothetical protein [Candidatus Woesearchaeota archaeon]